MEKSTDPFQKAFGDIIDSVGFVQHLSEPTHCHTHTLDLILYHGIDSVYLNVCFLHNPGLWIIHFIPFSIATNNSQTTQRYPDALPDSLHLPEDIGVQQSVNNLAEDLNLTLRNILNVIAPLKTK
jgi:hypothetical protein